MPFLRILCPIKNKSFATSVESSIEHKASLPNILKFSYCPYCHALHGWSPDEAFFNDTEYEAFLSEAVNIAASPGSNATPWGVATLALSQNCCVVFLPRTAGERKWSLLECSHPPFLFAYLNCAYFVAFS